MRITNQESKFENVDKQVGFKEKVARKFGAQLEKMAVESRACWTWGVFEPETPPEIMIEMVNCE